MASSRSDAERRSGFVGHQARWRTDDWLAKERSGSLLTACHTMIVPSEDEEAKKRPSNEHRTQ
jgi:hypothetical protein